MKKFTLKEFMQQEPQQQFIQRRIDEPIKRPQPLSALAYLQHNYTPRAEEGSWDKWSIPEKKEAFRTAWYELIQNNPKTRKLIEEFIKEAVDGDSHRLMNWYKLHLMNQKRSRHTEEI